MILAKGLVIAIRFLLELAALAAYAYWGAHTGKSMLPKLALGIGAPLLAAVVWGTFVAPNASLPVSVPIRLLLELAVFGLAAAALYAAGKKTLALAFVVTALVNMALMYAWKL